MTITSSMDLDERRQALLKRKLGELLDWTAPAITETVGPFDPSVFETYDAGRRSVIDTCVETLAGYSDDQVEMLYDKNDQGDNDLREGWRNLLWDRINHLRKHPPPWYAGGFGHPEYTADLEHWARMPHFTVEEMLCLSVGVEPASFPPEKLKDLYRSNHVNLRQPLQFLMRRYDQLTRKFNHDDVGRLIRPKDFLTWVNQVKFDVPTEFLLLLRDFHLTEPEAALANNAATARTDRREVDTIAQLFTAIAIDWLGYDPVVRRSSTPKEIADLMAKLGLSASDDTVRKYLKLGASFLPKDL